MSSQIGKEMRNATLRNQAKSMLKRVEDAEKAVAELHQGLTQVIEVIGKRLSNFEESTRFIEERLSAVVEILGAESVRDRVLDGRYQKAVKNNEMKRELIQKGVEAGYIFEKDVIGEKDCLVCTEYGKDGTVLGVPNFVVDVENLLPEYVKTLVGMPVGGKIPTLAEGTLEVLKVYQLDQQKYFEFQKAAQEAAQTTAPAPETDATPPVVDTAETGTGSDSDQTV